MTMAEFIDETDELFKFYGKELNSYERGIWFEELKTISAERYRQIVRECFRTQRFMPKLADILKVKMDLPAKIREEWEPVKCDKCDSMGIITYHQRDNQNGIDYLYGARCTCENGKRLSADIPLITQVFPVK